MNIQPTAFAVDLIVVAVGAFAAGHSRGKRAARRTMLPPGPIYPDPIALLERGVPSNKAENDNGKTPRPRVDHVDYSALE